MANQAAGIVRAWREGRYARGGALWTDGRMIYSYGLPIARRTNDVEVMPVVQSSRTTGRHVSAVAALIGNR